MASTPKPGANGNGKRAPSPRPNVMPNAPPNYSPHMTPGTMFGTGSPFPSGTPAPMPWPHLVPMPVPPMPMVNPAMSGMAGRHARVVAACPVLELHRPLAAAAAIHAELPPAHVGHAEVWSAVAKYLSQLRTSFLAGHPPPQMPGYSFSPAMVRSALLEDVLAGSSGLLGREHQASNGGATEGTGDGAFRSGNARGAMRPYADSLPRCPDAYVGFLRDGTFAKCVKRALEGPAHALLSPVAGGVHTGGAATVDFGLQRWVNPGQTKDPVAHLPRTLAPNPFKRRTPAGQKAGTRGTPADPADQPRLVRERWRTRHVEVTNDGNNSVLLLAATAAPATDAFRLRCDHEGLVRHPMDDGPPIDDQPPVVLPPGCRYEFSVDLRCDEASAKVGSLSQWVLVAVVEMPVGWKNKAGPADDVGPRSRHDDTDDGFDLMFDGKDVQVIGKRVGALVTGSRARAAEIGAMLDVDTPKFVPKRLGEAFDTLPLLTIAPVTLVDDDIDAAHRAEAGTDENDETMTAAWEKFQRTKAASEMVWSSRLAPAAYRGPRGVFLQRRFLFVDPWGEENSAQIYQNDAVWERVESSIAKRANLMKQMKTALARWTRLVRLEEAQQALDIRRYDAHSAVLTYTGPMRTVKARKVPITGTTVSPVIQAKVVNRGSSDNYDRYDVDVYSLEVPGLIEGYPPVARNDILRLRIVAVEGPHATEAENWKALPFDGDVTEVAATVVRVITRTSTVYVAVPPFFSRGTFTDNFFRGRWNRTPELHSEACRRSFRAHVRFAYDESAFRSQCSALESVSAKEPVTHMLREVPEVLPPNVEDPLKKAVTAAAAPGSPGVVGASSCRLPFLDVLNAEQLAVVSDVLCGTAAAVGESWWQNDPETPVHLGPPYCVLGPPGTGKTLTVVSAAAAVLDADPDARILLCAPAAFAADVLCSRLAELCPHLDGFEPLPKPMQDEFYERHLGMGSRDDGSLPGWKPGRMNFYETPEKALKARFSRVMVRVNDPRRDPASVKKDVLRFCAPSDSVTANRARVVVCSCASASLLSGIPDTRNSNHKTQLRNFTHIFIDEAGQATVPESLVPLRLVTPSCKAVVLAGDPMQLGPVVHSGVAARGTSIGTPSHSGLMTSLLESAAAHHSHPSARDTVRARCTRLVRNYRSHKDIVDLPSKLFYRNSLVACVDDSAVALPSSLIEDDEGGEGEDLTYAQSLTPVDTRHTSNGGHDPFVAAAQGWVRPPDPELRSKIFELRGLFPSHGDGYLAACAMHYGDSDRTASHILEDDLPPHIKSMPTDTSWPPPNCGVDGPPELGAQPALAAVVKRRTNVTAGHSGGSAVRSNPLARVLFFGVRGRQAREGKGEAPSFFNAVEAQELVNLVEAWLTRGEGTGDLGDRLKVSDVGVVAPYRSQVIRIRNLLRARNLGAVRVGTVDDYQGQEEKVMFISTVVSRAPSKHLAAAAKAAAAGSAGEASVASLRLGFLACPRRFNVAISRAKALNVVVGHPVALTHWPHWHSLLQHCYSRGAFLGSGAEFIPRMGGGQENVDPALESAIGNAEPDDEADFEELKRAVDMIAELSLLGGGDAEELWPDDDEMMTSAFQEDREWRVAL